MPQRPILLVILLFLALSPAACRRHEPAAPTETPDVAAGSQTATDATVSDRGVFVVRRDEREAFRESFDRSAGRVTATLSGGVEGARAEQTVNLREDETVESLEVRVTGGSADENQQWTIRIDGTTAMIEGSRANAPRQQATMEVPAGTIPNPVNDSIVMAEQVLRRAKRIGGERVEVPILSFSESDVGRVTVTFSAADRARIEGTGATVDVTTDAEGRILSARDEKQGVTVERSSVE